MDRKRQREMANPCYRKLKHKSNGSELKKSEVAANDSGKSRLNEIQTNSGMFTHKNKAITELEIAGKSQLSEVRKSSGMFIHKNKKMSARNKLNRAANELPPTVGSRSLARRIDM